jgi:hypothetical protein
MRGATVKIKITYVLSKDSERVWCVAIVNGSQLIRLILCRETIATHTHTHTHARTKAVFDRMYNTLKVARGGTYVNFEGSVHLHRKVELFYCDVFIPYYASLQPYIFYVNSFLMIQFDKILRYLYLDVWSTTMIIIKRIAFVSCSVLEMDIACNSAKQNSCLAAVSVLS